MNVSKSAYEMVVGLETHVELSTKDKNFLRLLPHSSAAPPTPTAAPSVLVSRAVCRC
jgi:Asp-tRNA(Asn)/Glu-tRNA(Gln) amidotransferase B subunit